MPSNRLSQAGWWVAVAIGVVAVSLVAVFVVANLLRAPDVSRERFDAAKKLWLQKGPASYDIQIKVSGRQPAVYEVQVRSGAAVAATRNGYALNRPHAIGTWSVDGMFDTMERDLENVERHATGKAPPGTPRVTIWGRFDPDYGYPANFTRVQWDNNYEVVWEVTKFEVVP